MTADALPYVGTKIPPRHARDWVTSAELINESGITYRQLDYWCRTGLLTAIPGKKAQGRFGDLPITSETPGSGYLRRFDQAQIHRAALIRALLDVGWSLQFCRTWADELLAEGCIDVGPITITIHPPGDNAA